MTENTNMGTGFQGTNAGSSRSDAGMRPEPTSAGNEPGGFGNQTAWYSGQVARRLGLAVLFAVVLFVCRWLAYQLRFDFNVWPRYQDQLEIHWVWVIPMQLACLYLFGQFSGIYRFFSLPDIKNLAYAIGLSGLLLYVIRFLEIGYSTPRGVILMQCLLDFLALGGIRSAWRLVYERHDSRQGLPALPERRVAIVGAGHVGASLLRELQARPGLGLLPVVVLDDDRNKWHSRLHGVPVAGPPENIAKFKRKYLLEEVIIAMPSAPAKRIGEVVKLLQTNKLKFETVPAIDQLATGRVKVTQLRALAIEDLLGREPVSLDTENIGRLLTNETVMVTGAGGSIGSELCRQIAAFGPRKLLLVDQSEVQLYQVEQELIALGHGAFIIPLVGDIVDTQRMGMILSQHRPVVIFHAAAHKHVPMMESQPGEAIKNNCLGTARLADVALEHGVARFVMISTDKAVNPVSVMGATKRLAEIYLQALFERHPQKTKFSTVRFGNVLGSSGSVVPMFTRQIAAGGPVTVTHPDVVRYFMTIPEAVGLVLQSCAQGQGGEIYVLDMGRPVKIADLARQMIELSGLRPGVDIEIKFVGLRPGEKLFEEINLRGEHYRPTRHPRVMSFMTASQDWTQVNAALERLAADAHVAESDELKKRLQLIVPEYTPYLSGGPDGVSIDRGGTEVRAGRAQSAEGGASRHRPRGAGLESDAGTAGAGPAIVPQGGDGVAGQTG